MKKRRTRCPTTSFILHPFLNVPRRGLGEAVHLGFGVFLAVLAVLHHVGESHQRLVGAAHRVQISIDRQLVALLLVLPMCRCHPWPSSALPVITTFNVSASHSGRSLITALKRSTQVRRLMQTIIALPSIASTRFLKCVTRSAAMSAMRFGSSTSASDGVKVLAPVLDPVGVNKWFPIYSRDTARIVGVVAVWLRIVDG